MILSIYDAELIYLDAKPTDLSMLAGFSIFANLSDVDLELDDLDLNEPITTQTMPAPIHIHRAPTPPPIPIQTLEANMDPNAPFFFPLPRDENGLVDLPWNQASRRGPRPRDLVDVLKVEGWKATTGTSGGGFWRTETEYVK